MPTSRIELKSNPAIYADFVRLDGDKPRGSGVELEPFTRPGVDGIGFVKLGKRGRPFTVVGFRDFEDLASAAASGDDLMALYKGEIVKVWDSTGTDYAECVVLDVRPRKPKAVLLGVGGLTAAGTMGAVAEFEIDLVYRK